MANTPLMPKATAVWLVDNTALSFSQIASFCRLHPLEVKAIADGEAAQGIKGLDPILTGQLTREEVEKAQKDPNYQLKLQGSKVVVPESKRKGPRYTPVSRRQDRPNAILWLVRNHPELKDAQIMRLVGTTKPTIAAIRDRTHWNSSNLTPSDPVTLGLCSQLELDMEVEKGRQEPAAAGRRCRRRNADAGRRQHQRRRNRGRLLLRHEQAEARRGRGHRRRCGLCEAELAEKPPTPMPIAMKTAQPKKSKKPTKALKSKTQAATTTKTTKTTSKLLPVL
ncbi:DUF1013 domain-containing protein [Roseibium salinum]|nr:DUF1013 domain-containing protein [Roseibium salinum]